jgi:hypothetical protein
LLQKKVPFMNGDYKEGWSCCQRKEKRSVSGKSRNP